MGWEFIPTILIYRVTWWVPSHSELKWTQHVSPMFGTKFHMETLSSIIQGIHKLLLVLLDFKAIYFHVPTSVSLVVSLCFFVSGTWRRISFINGRSSFLARPPLQGCLQNSWLLLQLICICSDVSCIFTQKSSMVRPPCTRCFALVTSTLHSWFSFPLR